MDAFLYAEIDTSHAFFISPRKKERKKKKEKKENPTISQPTIAYPSTHQRFFF